MLLKRKKKNALVAHAVPTLEQRRSAVKQEELDRMKRAIVNPGNAHHVQQVAETILSDFARELGHVQTVERELGEHFHVKPVFKSEN